MTNKLSFSDVLDVNKKTGALILGKNRLDDYATKFLTKYCKDALYTPMALPVEDILKSLNLKIEEISLSKNLDIFGCCLLRDSEIEVFDNESGLFKTKMYKKGTILIDPASEALHGEGCKRNTLIHEALHWEKDKAFFDILTLKSTDNLDNVKTIMCRQSEAFFEPSEGKKTKENEIKWLEWQAHRLAPRVLMPVEMFKKKTNEILANYQTLQLKDNFCCDTLITLLSDFFIVSRASVKYRLIETKFDNILKQFKDFDTVFSDIIQKNEYIPLTLIEAYEFSNKNTSFKHWINNGNFIYVDGYFVIADVQYIALKNGRFTLTNKAKKNLSKCVINITERKYVQYHSLSQDLYGYTTLYRCEGIDKRLLTFHPEFQSNLDYKNYEDDCYKFFSYYLNVDDDYEKKLIVMLADPDLSLCNCLWYLIEKKWKYPSDFVNATFLHSNYHGKIKRDDYNDMGTAVLLAICIALKLKPRIIDKIFEKSKNKLNYYKDPDKTYMRILENMPGISLHDFNSICKHIGVKTLGTKEKK